MEEYLLLEKSNEPEEKLKITKLAWETKGVRDQLKMLLK